MSWLCPKCNLNNIAANTHCADVRCKHPRPENVVDDEISRLIRDKQIMTEQAEKHAQFFNHERILVRDMDVPTLRKHRQELQDIAFEARARLTAIDAEERERNAQLTSEQRQWITSTDNDVNVSDAIETVKRRKERMSKADKLREQLSNPILCLTKEQIDEMVANVERKATSKQMDSLKFVSNKQDESQPEPAHSPDTHTQLTQPIEQNNEPFNPDELFK